MTDKKDWQRVRFGDVIDNVNDFFDRCNGEATRYVAGEHIDEGDIRVRRYGMTTDDLVPPTFNRLFKTGDVLFHSRNIKKLVSPDFDGITGEKLFILRSKNQEVLLQEFLPYLLQTERFNNYVRERWAGSTNKFLNKTPLMAYEFALPPKDEQQRMVLMLDALEDNLATLSEALESVIVLEISRLEGALDSFQSDSLIPVERLLMIGPRNGLSPKVNADECGYPTLSISAVRDGRIVTEGNIKYAEITNEQATSFALKANDILVVRGNGNKLLTGKCGLVGTVPKGCFYPDLLIRLQFEANIIRPQFAALQWNTPSVHKRLISRAKSTNGIWKINGSDIRQHALKVPSLEKQDALLDEIRLIRESRSNIEKRKILTQHLKGLALKKIA